jgi:hypothetical protein
MSLFVNAAEGIEKPEAKDPAKIVRPAALAVSRKCLRVTGCLPIANRTLTWLGTGSGGRFTVEEGRCCAIAGSVPATIRKIRAILTPFVFTASFFKPPRSLEAVIRVADEAVYAVKVQEQRVGDRCGLISLHDQIQIGHMANHAARGSYSDYVRSSGRPWVRAAASL